MERSASSVTGWLLVFRLPLLSFAFAFGCFIIDGPTSLRFFELAGQILPVLLLAFALEFRLLTPGSRPGTGDLLDVTFLFLVLAWGEWIALDAVAAGAGTENEGTVVAAAVLAGFVGVGLGAITANATPPPRPAWTARIFNRPQEQQHASRERARPPSD